MIDYDTETLALFDAIPAGVPGVQLWGGGSSPAWIERTAPDGRTVRAIWDGVYLVQTWAAGVDVEENVGEESGALVEAETEAEALALLLA